jgi:beta-lactamase superfamily II metal-dependent hydrolase
MTDAPHESEIEVSLFGPGYGESAVVHIGDGDWIVIASCRQPETRESVPLQYLEAIGVDVANDVKILVATHWHDDHVAGLDDLYEACASAVFVCSAAVQSKDFRTLVSSRFEVAGRSGVDVMGRILSIMKDRRRSDPTVGRIEFAAASKRLLKKRDGLHVDAYALSPSSDAMLRGMQVIASLLPQEDKETLAVRSPDPNDTSIAVWIDIAGEALLFGADLEEERFGNWTEILASTTRPQGTASMFKVPHHGSGNGHHQGVWQSMLTGATVAIVSPWRRGGNHLPKDTDIERICGFAGTAFLSADPAASTRSSMVSAVAKTLKEHQIELIQDLVTPGHVRLRKRIGDLDWQVQLGAGAKNLCA